MNSHYIVVGHDARAWTTFLAEDLTADELTTLAEGGDTASIALARALVGAGRLKEQWTDYEEHPDPFAKVVNPAVVDVSKVD